MEAGNASSATGTIALVGPGRAGTTIALALLELGWRVTSVAGRAPDAPSTVAAAACLGADQTLLTDVARGASIVIIATPDRAIEGAARAIGPSIEPDALVFHLAGSLGLGVFSSLLEARADVRVGALHPLQLFPSASMGIERLRGAWAAVAGDPQATELARAMGMRPFELPDSERAQYHAAAVVASNHLVALLGQVERLAGACGVPFEAFAPLVRSSVADAFALGPARALTGPVSRGDLATVEKHLATLDPGERDAYRTLAREVARLTGRRDHAIDRLLDDMRHAPDNPPSSDPA
jgi:predicted short-subunit dehydrogenase-like oxidoreductase (DUF2520 family)